MLATKSFKDLRVWQTGHELVLEVYKVSESFPKDEKFELTNQLRRAVVSITSNVAEGYGRKLTKDKEHFYVMARGSVTEVRNHLTIAHDLSYLSDKQYTDLETRALVLTKMINALLRAHKNF